MEFEIRKSTIDYLKEIVDLMREDDFGKTREGDSIEEYLSSYIEISENPNFEIYVMLNKENNEIIGTYQIMFLPHLSFKGTKRAQVESVRVKQGLRSQGLGKALMEHSIKVAKENNCGILQLTSNKDRVEDTHRFYENLGFQATHVGYKLYIDDDR